MMYAPRSAGASFQCSAGWFSSTSPCRESHAITRIQLYRCRASDTCLSYIPQGNSNRCSSWMLTISLRESRGRWSLRGRSSIAESRGQVSRNRVGSSPNPPEMGGPPRRTFEVWKAVIGARIGGARIAQMWLLYWHLRVSEPSPWGCHSGTNTLNVATTKSLLFDKS